MLAVHDVVTGSQIVEEPVGRACPGLRRPVSTAPARHVVLGQDRDLGSRDDEPLVEVRHGDVHPGACERRSARLEHRVEPFLGEHVDHPLRRTLGADADRHAEAVSDEPAELKGESRPVPVGRRPNPGQLSRECRGRRPQPRSS